MQLYMPQWFFLCALILLSIVCVKIEQFQNPIMEPSDPVSVLNLREDKNLESLLLNFGLIFLVVLNVIGNIYWLRRYVVNSGPLKWVFNIVGIAKPT